MSINEKAKKSLRIDNKRLQTKDRSPNIMYITFIVGGFL
jgi:hypothetical protein